MQPPPHWTGRGKWTRRVVVPLDEVKAKAPPPPHRAKEVWTSTAVVPRAGWRDVLVDATKPGRFEQLAAAGGGASELEAVRQNGDWAGWWPDRSLPAWKFPEPLRRAG